MASLRDVKREWRENSRHKLPPITHANRMAVRRFLDRVLKSAREQLRRNREVLRTQPDDRTRGLVNYWNHYCSCLNDLIAQNEARRSYGKVR